MTYTPTAEQFLAMSEPDEQAAFTAEHVDPLESIALSLAAIAVTFTQRADDERDHVEADERSQLLQEAYDDAVAQHVALYQLVEEIETIIKPSTSKLANQVREAIGRWRAPEVEPVEEMAEWERELLEAEEAKRAAETAETVNSPANDAPVEVWRTYARKLGLNVSDDANRSQIRTALGLPHFDAP